MGKAADAVVELSLGEEGLAPINEMLEHPLV